MAAEEVNAMESDSGASKAEVSGAMSIRVASITGTSGELSGSMRVAAGLEHCAPRSAACAGSAGGAA